MKGLGFGRGKEDEVTGLNVFSDLLSRLNGKSEEDVEGDRRARLVMKTNVYVEQRWGPMRFVKGGLLVGENVEERNASDESSAAPEMDEMRKSKDEPSMKESKSKSKSKKRKLEDIEDKDAEADAKKEKKRRKEERRARKAAARSALGETEDAHHSTDAKPRKKSTKNKPLPSDDMGTEYADDGSRRRARKAKSKDKRPVAEEAAKAGSASKKDKREKSRSEKTDIDAAAASSSEPEDDGGPALTTGTSTPTGSGTGTSTPRGGRNFVRSRFIAAKRQAMLDAKSLNQVCALDATAHGRRRLMPSQIFMIKT